MKYEKTYWIEPDELCEAIRRSGEAIFLHCQDDETVDRFFERFTEKDLTEQDIVLAAETMVNCSMFDIPNKKYNLAQCLDILFAAASVDCIVYDLEETT